MSDSAHLRVDLSLVMSRLLDPSRSTMLRALALAKVKIILHLSAPRDPRSDEKLWVRVEEDTSNELRALTFSMALDHLRKEGRANGFDYQTVTRWFDGVGGMATLRRASATSVFDQSLEEYHRRLLVSGRVFAILLSLDQVKSSGRTTGLQCAYDHLSDAGISPGCTISKGFVGEYRAIAPFAYMVFRSDHTMDCSSLQSETYIADLMAQISQRDRLLQFVANYNATAAALAARNVKCLPIAVAYPLPPASPFQPIALDTEQPERTRRVLQIENA